MPSTPPQPSVNPWLIAFTVSLATFMEVMDTSIVNVALRHIAGSLAAGQSESTWVLTTYLVSNAIVLPASGWLASVLGRKRFYMSCVVVFTASSFLCGIAPNLAALLACRVLQGVGGGGLAPSEQAILTDTFPEERRGLAFALYGVAVVVAPAIGPVLGGWITDQYSWRWIFFINIPVGAVSLLLTSRLVQDSQGAIEEHEAAWRGGLRVDYLGFGLLTIGLGSLQIMLDKGQEDDWFASTLICVCAALAAIGILALVIRELRCEDPIVDLPLFKNTSFFFTTLVMFAVFFVLLSTTQLLPQFVQELMGYDATTAGLILMPGGFTIMALMPVAGWLVGKVQPKWLIAFGLIVVAASMEHLTSIDTEVSFRWLAIARMFQASGLAFLFVPINTAAYIGLPANKTNNASALINTMRNLGGSVGVSVVTTMLDRRGQLHHVRLVSHLTPYDPGYRHAAARAARLLAAHGAHASAAARGSLALLARGVERQAATLSYVDVFRMLAVASLCMLTLALGLKRLRPGEKVAAAG